MGVGRSNRLQCIFLLPENGQEERTSVSFQASTFHMSTVLSPVENCFESMKQFRNFRKLFSIPNGAIWKVQFQSTGETRFSNIQTSHLGT